MKIKASFFKQLLFRHWCDIPCLRSLFLPGSIMETNSNSWRQNSRQTIHGNTVWYEHKTTCMWVCACIPVSGSSCLSTLCPADGCCLFGDSACHSGSASTPVSSATRKKIWKKAFVSTCPYLGHQYSFWQFLKHPDSEASGSRWQ